MTLICAPEVRLPSTVHSESIRDLPINTGDPME